jgi:hypothetical protein
LGPGLPVSLKRFDGGGPATGLRVRQLARAADDEKFGRITARLMTCAPETFHSGGRSIKAHSARDPAVTDRNRTFDGPLAMAPDQDRDSPFGARLRVDWREGVKFPVK